jgi:hypothetical protein
MWKKELGLIIKIGYLLSVLVVFRIIFLCRVVKYVMSLVATMQNVQKDL